MTAAALRCPRHPERPGVGICVACKRVCCADCATKLDGINHCRECLEAKIGKARRAPGALRRAAERIVAAGAIAAAFVALTGAYYALGREAADLGWFGGQLAATAEALEDAGNGLERFHGDVGRFPTADEGLRALETDDPLDTRQPIGGWRGPYVHARTHGSGRSAAPPADPLVDGYGHRLVYVEEAMARGPAVISVGANGALDTDPGRLEDGDGADGDDRIRWVR